MRKFAVLLTMIILGVASLWPEVSDLRAQRTLFGEVKKKDPPFPVNKEESPLSTLLANERDPLERIQYLDQLDVHHDLIREEVLHFIISPNPYEDELKDAGPHGQVMRKFERENALRLFALRKLVENLSLEKLQEIVTFIENESDDEALKELTKLSWKARLRGGNYFESIIKAIASNGAIDE